MVSYSFWGLIECKLQPDGAHMLSFLVQLHVVFCRLCTRQGLNKYWRFLQGHFLSLIFSVKPFILKKFQTYKKKQQTVVKVMQWSLEILHLSWVNHYWHVVVVIVFDFLWPHGLHHAQLPYPSLSLRVFPSSCPLISGAMQPSHPLLPSSPFAFNFSQYHSLSSESALCIRWAKYWSFRFSKTPSSEYSRLISFRIDWFDLLTVQGTLKSLLQHHSSKASILRHSTFLTVQLSHPYVTTRKTIALTVWTFVGKVMSLLFNTQSRFVIAFLPKSKCLLISWLQSPSTVILQPKKRKSVTASTFTASIWSEGIRCCDLSFFHIEF